MNKEVDEKLKLTNHNNDFLYTPFFEVHHHYTLNGNTWKGLA